MKFDRRSIPSACHLPGAIVGPRHVPFVELDHLLSGRAFHIDQPTVLVGQQKREPTGLFRPARLLDCCVE
jgi:hypothetical protein